jgi:hypothetical protein
VSALRFFFGVTLGRGDAEVGMTTVRQPRRLPVILSPEEVAREPPSIWWTPLLSSGMEQEGV